MIIYSGVLSIRRSKIEERPTDKKRRQTGINVIFDYLWATTQQEGRVPKFSASNNR